MATETEIEAMARALSHQAQEDPNVMWRNWTSQAAVAANALDRVRAEDTRDDNQRLEAAAAAYEFGVMPGDESEATEDEIREMARRVLAASGYPAVVEHLQAKDNE